MSERHIVPLTKVIEDYGPHISPEVLAIVLVEALTLLEKLHRQRMRKAFFGAFSADAIQIDTTTGEVRLGEPVSSQLTTSFQAPEVVSGAHLTPASDIYAVAALFFALMTRCSARIHLRLHGIFSTALDPDPAQRFFEVWTFRAALLDLIDDLGISGEDFGVKYLLRDPVGYNHALSAALARREGALIRRLVRQGERKQARSELTYLFAIAPESREAYELMQLLRKSRHRVAALAGYALGLITLFVAGASVVAFKLHLSLDLPFTAGRLKDLIIEPTDMVTDRSDRYDRYGRRPSNAVPGIELRKIVTNEKHAGGSGLARILLRLDGESVATVIATAITAPTDKRGLQYRDGEVISVPEGRYTIVVEKPGFPQAASQVDLRAGDLLTLIETVLID